jgi:hypothetical protein
MVRKCHRENKESEGGWPAAWLIVPTSRKGSGKLVQQSFEFRFALRVVLTYGI